MGRYVEIWGDIERYGEISGEIPWKTGGITSRCGAMALQMDDSQCIAMAGFPSPGYSSVGWSTWW